MPAIWIWLLHKQESWKVELAATQAGGVWKLETGCYTSRKAGRWKLAAIQAGGVWKLELAAIQAGGVWVSGYLELLL